MKLWLIFCLVACCQAQVILTPRNPDDFGNAVQFNNQDGLGQYDFGYTEGHPSGATFRRETGDALGNKFGSFGLRDADGRVRVVKYVADANGFRAEVTSNEPGVAPQDPASATINKPSILPLNAAPVVPVSPVAAVPPPPPPPPPAPFAVPKAFPPPAPLSYNYLAPAVAPVALPAPPPPPSLFPPRYVAPIAAPLPPYPAPVAVAQFSKTVGAVGAVPPPIPAYYSNLIPGKGYVSAVRSYPSLLPPFAAVPPQYNYLSGKSPPPYQAFGYPL